MGQRFRQHIFRLFLCRNRRVDCYQCSKDGVFNFEEEDSLKLEIKTAICCVSPVDTYIRT